MPGYSRSGPHGTLEETPYIAMHLPVVVFPEKEFSVEVTMENSSSAAIDRLLLTFSGSETVRLTAGGPTYGARPIVNDRRVLSAQTQLPQRERWTVPFFLPRSAPGSHRGYLTVIHYQMALAATIPGQLDFYESQEVVVMTRPGRRPPKAPLVSRTQTMDRQFLEVTLNSCFFSCGEHINGTVVVDNNGDITVYEADIAIIGTSRVRVHDLWAATEIHRSRTLLHSAGQHYTFSIQAPWTSRMSFNTAMSSTTWAVEVYVKLRNGSLTHRIPIVIDHALPEPARSIEDVLDPAGASQRRLRAEWRAIAARHGLTLNDNALELRGFLSFAEVVIKVEDKEGDSTGLTAELLWISFDINLHLLGPRRPLLGADAEIAAADRRVIVSGREPAQVRALLSAPVRRALRGLDDVSLLDDRAHVRSARSSPDATNIQAFVARVVTLAQALDAARSRIPPPAAMKAFLPAWRSFADEVGARLSIGRMALHDLRFEGVTFQVITCFDRNAEPNGTTVILTNAAHRGAGSGSSNGKSTLVLDEGSTMSQFSSTEARIRALGYATESLSTGPDFVKLELSGPIADPAGLRHVFREMLVFLPWIRANRAQGPYR